MQTRKEPNEVVDLCIAIVLAAACLYAAQWIANAILAWVAEDFAWVRGGPTASAFAEIGWGPISAVVAFSTAALLIYIGKLRWLLLVVGLYAVIGPIFEQPFAWSGSTFWLDAVQPMRAFHATIAESWLWMQFLLIVLSIGTVKRLDGLRSIPLRARKPRRHAEAANSA